MYMTVYPVSPWVIENSCTQWVTGSDVTIEQLLFLFMNVTRQPNKQHRMMYKRYPGMAITSWDPSGAGIFDSLGCTKKVNILLHNILKSRRTGNRLFKNEPLWV